MYHYQKLIYWFYLTNVNLVEWVSLGVSKSGNYNGNCIKSK